MTTTDAALPSSIESERIVLGSMMQYRDACLTAHERLTADDFYRPVHQELFSALSEPLDAVALSARVETDQLYVLEVEGNASMGWKHHVGIVAATAESRRVIRAGRDIETAGREGATAADAIARVMSLAKEPTEAVPIDLLMKRRISDYSKPTESFMLPASSVKLHYGDVTILAGRPGTGKTAYAMIGAWLLSASRKVAFYSYEMSPDELGDRFISHITGVSTDYAYEGLKESEQSKYRGAIDTQDEHDLTIVGCSGWTESQLEAALSLFAAKGGRLAVVDYLQIAYDITRAGENADITRMSKMLRRTAKTTGIGLLAVSQFRRFEGADDTEKRVTYPKMSDLRGSGSLEQDAANICLMYGYPPAFTALGDKARANLREKHSFAADLQDHRTLLRLHWAKVRHGRAGGKTWVFFDGAAMRFEDIDVMKGA